MEDDKKQGRKVRPFFIMAVLKDPDYAKKIRAGKEEAEDDYHYVSSDSIRTIVSVKEGAGNDVSKVYIQGASVENSYYIPLPPEKLLALFRENGYEIYGPGKLKKIASVDYEDTPSPLPPSVP